LQQSIGASQIIIVNDGSTSLETLDVLKEIENGNSLIIKIFSIENTGASLARKYGVDRANSTFILFLDADDYLEKNALEILFEEQIAKNADVVVGHFNLVKLDDILPFNGFEILSTSSENIARAFLMGKLPITLWPNLYRRLLFDKVQFYDYIVGEDMVINAQIFTQKPLRLSVVDEVIYNYVQHDESLTKKINQNKTEQGFLASEKSLNIIETNCEGISIDMELCHNRLNTLYAAIILNANRNIIDSIRNLLFAKQKTALKEALDKFPVSKKILLRSVLYAPIVYPAIARLITVLRTKRVTS
jgi:glycosyltransferase involved in cell wall biosynthesis